MPFIQLETNFKVEDSKTLVQKLLKFSGETLKVPTSLILAKYTHNETLCWDGTFDPAFVLVVASIGQFEPAKNPHYIAEFTKFLKETLGVEDKRGYVLLTDPGSDFVGYSGITVAQRLRGESQ